MRTTCSTMRMMLTTMVMMMPMLRCHQEQGTIPKREGAEEPREELLAKHW